MMIQDERLACLVGVTEWSLDHSGPYQAGSSLGRWGTLFCVCVCA